MSLNQYKNIQDINTQTKQQRGVRYTELLNREIPSYDLFTNFGKDINDTLELHVYSQNNTYIASNQQVLNYSLSNVSPNLENKPTIIFNTQQDLVDLELPNGKYKIVYNLMRNLLGSFNSIDQYLYIGDISTDRTELRVYPVNQDNKQYISQVIQFANSVKGFYEYWPDTIMNFSKNIVVPVINWQLDDFTTPEYPYSLILKLYEPLPTSLKEKDLFWISTEVANPIIDYVNLQVPIVPAPTNLVKLKSPNFNLDLVQKVGYDTDYKSWDDVLGTNPVSSQQLINMYLNDISGSIKGIPLNIDYSDYNNFVHFSSATERLNNFKYKLQLIEEYNLRIYSSSIMSGSTNATVQSYMTQSLNKIDQIISSFDGFEHHLYYESGSTYINSFGTVIDRTWPKQNSTKPYVLHPTTSSIAITWFENEIAAALDYDRNNRDALVESIPMHIRMEENEDGSYKNESYMLFVNMIAQHYDIMWLYINNLNEAYNKEQKLTEGIAKDLIYHFVESFGWDLDDGITIDGLWETALGVDESDTYITGSNGLEYITPQDRQKEIWKRIYNNLPVLLKQKGTARGIRALISCYGVPSTILRIKEYGGTTYQNSEYEIDKYTYSLIFSGSQYIEVPSITDTQTVQFRFKPYSSSVAPITQSLLSSPTFDLSLYYSASVYGQLFYNGTSSIQLPIFDGNYWNIMITSGSTSSMLYAYRFNNDRFTYQWSSSVSPSIDDNIMYIGTDQTKTYYYTGSMQEFRIWNSELTPYEFEAYCKNPDAYFTMSPTSSFDTLQLRYTLSNPNYYTTSGVEVYDYNPSQNTINYGTASLTLTTSSFESFIDIRHIKTPKYWGNKITSDKVRIESSSLYGNLDFKKKSEHITDTRAFDSPKLGINFSPIDMINEDIFAQMGDFVLDNYIGNPSDQFNPSYKNLDMLRNFYFAKYPRPNNVYDYIKYIKLYDKSLFKQIKKLLPERNNAIVGLSYDSHILERPKYEWKPMSVTSESREDNITYDLGVTSDVINYDVTNNEYLTYFTMTGSNIQLTSKIEDYKKIFNIDSQYIELEGNALAEYYGITSNIPTSLSQILDVSSYYSSSAQFGNVVDTLRPSVAGTETIKFNEKKLLYDVNIDIANSNYYYPNKILNGTFTVASSSAPTTPTIDGFLANNIKRFFINTNDLTHDRNDMYLNYLNAPTDTDIKRYIHITKVVQGAIDSRLASNKTALYEITGPATMSYTTKTYVGYTIDPIIGNVLKLASSFGDVSNQFFLYDTCSFVTQPGVPYVTSSINRIVSKSYYDGTNTCLVFEKPISTITESIFYYTDNPADIGGGYTYLDTNEDAGEIAVVVDDSMGYTTWASFITYAGTPNATGIDEYTWTINSYISVDDDSQYSYLKIEVYSCDSAGTNDVLLFSQQDIKLVKPLTEYTITTNFGGASIIATDRIKVLYYAKTDITVPGTTVRLQMSGSYFKSEFSNRIENCEYIMNRVNYSGRSYSADTFINGYSFNNNVIEIPVNFKTYYNDPFSFPEQKYCSTSQFELYFYSEKTQKSDVYVNYYDDKKYRGFLNTSNTTIDKKEPVEIYRAISPIDTKVGDKLDNITDGIDTVY